MRTQNNANVTLSAGVSTKVSESKRGSGRRIVLAVTNTDTLGGNVVTISVGQEAAANKGIYLLPGQAFIWSADSGYIPPQDVVSAYSVGTPILTIYEEIEA